MTRIHNDQARKMISLYQTDFNQVLARIAYHIESAIELDESRPTCCGQTENLRSGRAAGNLIWLCPACAREALSRGE